MTTRPSIVAVDWGTSSFRLWALDHTGTVVDERQGGFGMSTLKPADFEPVLEESLSSVDVDTQTPVIICGMAGAAQGWCEAVYAELPVNLSALPKRAIRVPGIGRDVRILPGLAQRTEESPDVMRGEETILLGAVLHSDISGAICMPGTHSKWVQVDAGSVTQFSTAMTGELFGLLATHSTLSHFVQAKKTSFAGNRAFKAGVIEAINHPEQLSRALFSIRAIPLLQGSSAALDMSARLSGLLIGAELAGMRQSGGNHVTLVSSGVLANNYQYAFDVADIACQFLDADRMARAGLFAAAKTIWPNLIASTKD